MEDMRSGDFRQLRERINCAVDDPELDALCNDCFPEIYEKFSRGMRKDEKVTLLLHYCRNVPALHQQLLNALQAQESRLRAQLEPEEQPIPQSTLSPTTDVSPHRRRYLFWGIASIVMALMAIAIARTLLWSGSQRQNTEQLTLALAKFTPRQGADQADANLIQTKVREALDVGLTKAQIDDDVNIVEIDAIESIGQAREVGEREKADLVIWGWVSQGTDGELDVHFQLMETVSLVRNASYSRAIPITHLDQSPSAAATIPASDLLPKELQAKVSPIVLFSMGLVHYYNSSFGEAVMAFESALHSMGDSANDPENPAKPLLIHYYLGKSYQMLQQWDDALYHLEQAEKAPLDQREPAVYLALASIHMAQNPLDHFTPDQDIQRAIEICESLKELGDQEHKAAYLYDLALAYEIRAAWDPSALDHAATYYSQVRDSYPARLGLARVYEQQEKYQLAIDTLKSALQDTAEIHIALGRIHERQGQESQAEREYRQASKLGADEAYRYLGRLYLKRGEYQDAIRVFEKRSALLEHKDAWAYADLGYAYVDAGQLEDAAKQYQQATLLGPNEPFFWTELSWTYVEAKQYDNAEEILNEAIANMPDWPGFYLQLGQVYEYKEQKEAAIRNYQRCLDLAGDDPFLQDPARQGIERLEEK
jgi:tetratricopeptide (TPR) repeat protein